MTDNYYNIQESVLVAVTSPVSIQRKWSSTLRVIVNESESNMTNTIVDVENGLRT